MNTNPTLHISFRYPNISLYPSL